MGGSDADEGVDTEHDGGRGGEGGDGMGRAEGRGRRGISSGGPVGGVMSEVEHKHPGTLYRLEHSQAFANRIRFGKRGPGCAIYTLQCKTACRPL